MRYYSVFIFLAFANLVLADFSLNFLAVASEMSTVTDDVTGYELRYLTSDRYMNTACYPHNRGWTADCQYVFIESDRPRPDGTPSTGIEAGDYHRIERQLFAVNVDNGDMYWLTSLEVEDTTQYGNNHIVTSTQYHIDYAPKTNMLVYYDMTGHRLYSLNLTTGSKHLLWHFTTETLGDPPSISWDGKTVIVYTYSLRPSDSAFFQGSTTSVYRIDMNPQTGVIVGMPQLFYSYSNLFDDRGDICINHTIVDPMDSSQMTFCHSYVGGYGQSVQRNRVWYAKTDGSLIKALTDTYYLETHEVWGFSSKYSYFVRITPQDSNIVQVDVNNGDQDTIFSSISLNITHIGVNKTENLFAFDTFDDDIDDYNRKAGVWLYNKSRDILIHLSSQNCGFNHPRHPHPIISYDSTMVAFNVAANNDDGIVAVVDIE